ncbi:MAG: helix-turn-helix transcriptional regulator [bacterium]|nr:helix-turn-helix transcriptional regulator [bacterium]
MDYSYDREVGLRIRAYRMERRLTQDQLAAKLQVNGYDLTRGAVAKIESGQRHIYLYELKAIKEVLRVSFDDLLL